MYRTFVIVCLIVGAALAAMSVAGSPNALWLQFDRMTLAERQNAELSLQPGPNALAGAWDESRDICRLWNSGDFDAALERLRGFWRFDDPSEVAVAVSWRRPVECLRQALDAAVRIGTRDSIFDLSMDRSADGTLWALTPCYDSALSLLHVCKSTNNGSSWSNVAAFGFDAGSSYLKAWSAACNGAYYQVSFSERGEPNLVWCARLRMSDGAWVHMRGDSAAVIGITAAPGDTVLELAECSQEDTLPGFRVYLFGRTKNRLLCESWSDSTCGTWTPHSTGVTNCDNGLDCAFSEGSTEKKLWASWLHYFGSDSAFPAYGYLTTADTFFHHTDKVAGCNARHSTFEPTSISAWYDTVGIAYTPPWGRCRILTTPNAGNSWFVGDLTPYEADTAEFPEVSGRNGGGFVAAYRVRTTAANCWVDAIHSDLVGGPYSAPDTISDNTHRPSPTAHIRVVPLGSGAYGVGWINWDDAVYGGAWFTTYTPPGIAERPGHGLLPLSFRALLRRGGADLCFENPAAGPVRLRVFDGTGRLISTDYLTLAADRQAIGFRAPTSGVYVAVLEAAGKTASARFAAVK
jgi:hypothetical protein